MQVYAELPQPEHIINKINAYEKKVYCATTPAHTHHEQLLLEQTTKVEVIGLSEAYVGEIEKDTDVSHGVEWLLQNTGPCKTAHRQHHIIM